MKDPKLLTRYIEKDSSDSKIFLKRLYFTTKKSNRDALCVACWRIFPQESRVRHQKIEPDHI